MLSARIIARNIASNWTSFAVQALVTFFLTPFVLRELGATRYGVWALLMSLTGYYGILDVGLRAGLTQYLTRYLARGDHDGLNRTASTGVAALSICSLLLLMLTAVAGLLSPALFSIPSAAQRELFWCILIIGGGTAIQSALFPFSALFAAAQRYDLSSAIGIFTRLSTALGIGLVLRLDSGIIGLSLVTAAGNLIDYGLRWRVAYKILPSLHVAFRLARWGSFREIVFYGFWSFLANCSVRVAESSFPVVIAAFMPGAAVTWFALSRSMAEYVERIFVPAAQVFFPAATCLDSKGDVDALQRMYLTSSRLLFVAATAVVFLAGLFADDFYRIWVGEEYVAGTTYVSVALLFKLLAVGTLFTVGQRIGNQVLMAQRKMRPLVLSTVIDGVLRVALAVLLVRPFGLVGVVCAATIPAVAIQGVVQPWIVCSSVGIAVSQYLRTVLLRPAFLMLAFTPFWLAWQAAEFHPTNWFQLVLGGAAAGMVVAAMCFSIGLTPTEKEVLFYRLTALRRRVLVGGRSNG